MAVNRSYTKDYDLGGGELFIKLPNSNNFEYFGTTNEVKINTNVDKLEHKNSESETLTTDLEIVKEVSATVSFTTEDLSKKVLALAFGGNYEDVSQVAGSATDQEFDAVEGGKVYDLGKVKVSNVAVTYDDGNGNAVTATEDVDYSVNYNFGKIEIANDSVLVGKNIKVSYDYADATYTDVSALNDVSKEVALKFLSNPQVGKGKETTIHRVVLTMSGDYNLKSIEKFNSVNFSGKILKDGIQVKGKQFFETRLVGA